MKRSTLLVLLLASVLLVSPLEPVSATVPPGQIWALEIDSPAVIGGSEDLKTVYTACNGTHLFLLAEFYDTIPRGSEHMHEVNFWLDTDMNQGTGSLTFGVLGAEFEIWIAASGEAPRGSALHKYDSGSQSWIHQPYFVEVLFETGDDYLGAAVAMNALGTHVGDTLGLVARSYVEGFDSFADPIAYTVGLHSIPINLDGHGSDWTQETKKLSDSRGDLPSSLDFTDLYITDWSGKLYFRFDYAAPPFNVTFPQGAIFWYNMTFFLDTDLDPETGGSYGTSVSGAEYRIENVAVIHSNSKAVFGALWKWNGTSWEDISETVIFHFGFLEDIIEYSLPLSGLSIGVGSSFNMYLVKAGGWFDKSHPIIPSATFTVHADVVATPTFSPGGGTYSSGQSVTISCGTSGATIRYTLDGSEPTYYSPMYSSPISVNAGTVTIKAKASRSRMTDSATASATYTIMLKVATPSFIPGTGTYSSSQSVTISCSTSGATTHYSLDGSEPTSSSAAYSGPISVSSTTAIKARAFKSGMTDSDIASATYTIMLSVATPTFSPAAGSYSSGQSVTISCGTSGATIRYTLDGSEPTSSSTTYSAPIAVNTGTVTVKAKAFMSGMTDSATASATYAVSESGALLLWSMFGPSGIVGIAVLAIALILLWRSKK